MKPAVRWSIGVGVAVAVAAATVGAAMAFGGGSGGSGGSAGTGGGGHGGGAVSAVDWSMDEPSRTITATVRLAFYGPGANGGSVANIVNAITSAWNGHQYKCWKFVVKVNSDVPGAGSDGTDGAAKDELPIRIVDKPSKDDNVGGYTTVNDGAHNDPLSTAPEDTLTPKFDKNDPSQWPTSADDSVYTHEFGHVMGLDDNYDRSSKDPLLVTGAKGDAMFHANQDLKNWVSEDMIDRAINRSGKIDTSKIHCNMTMDTNKVDLIFGGLASVKGISLHAWTCDYDMPSNDPKRHARPMHWQGKINIADGKFLSKDGPGTGDLGWDATVDPSGKGGTFSIKVGDRLTMTVDVEWENNGVLKAKDAFIFDGLSTKTITAGGQGMWPDFKDSAAECPA